MTAEKKRELLFAFAKECKVPLSQTLCVGDGANDLLMLGACGSSGGIAIAYKAKDVVQKNAPNRLNSESLSDVLYLVGLDPRMVDDPVGNGNGISENEMETELMPDTSQ